MPSDSPTVGDILRRQAGVQSGSPATGVRRRTHQLRCGRTPVGATGPWTHHSRRGQGYSYRAALPQRCRLCGRHAGSGTIGAVVVPIFTFATASELREQLVDSDVEILLAASSHRSHDYVRRLGDVLTGSDLDSEDRRLFDTAAPQLRHVLFDVARVDRVAESVDEKLLSAMEDDVNGSDPLVIIYTSGTSGTPKGVVHTHAALLTHQRNLHEIRGLTATDKLFCNSPFSWIGGFGFALLATLVAGSTLVCSNAEEAAETLDLLEAEKPTITNGFAAGVAHLLRHASFGRRDLSSMRRGNLYPIMAPEARPADPELRHNMLELTEAGSVALISADETDQPEYRRGSFGKPAPGFEIKIVEPESGTLVEDGQLGELCIRGPYLMQRYYKRSREDCFDADGWFHTGVLMAADRDGFVYFIRRCGSLIKTAGANVSPPEVEKAIAKVSGGMVALVLGIPDADQVQAVAAVIAVENGAIFDETALREQLKAELSAYKIPRRFAVLRAADIPLLSSGKVDVQRLRRVFDA